ncbi:hypothetical protein M5689_002803 [Euphorbia peplus]|nr:hypothetical protein M5689_002803 [Euphorbia peplus]
MASFRASGSSSHRSMRRDICDCGFEAVVRTSWTNDNPGRRFYNCRNRGTRHGSYNYFLWIDDKLEDIPMSIVLGLLRKLERMEIECAQLRETGRRNQKQEIAEDGEKAGGITNGGPLMKSGDKSYWKEKCFCFIFIVIFVFLAGMYFGNKE